MVTPNEDSDKFYILTSSYGEDYPILVKVTFKEEDGFIV